MAVTTDAVTAPRAAAAATLAEAFQMTVARLPDRVALRTKDDATSLTWAQYGERVRRGSPPASHALGVGRGDTVALFLGNRPEFHSVRHRRGPPRRRRRSRSTARIRPIRWPTCSRDSRQRRPRHRARHARDRADAAARRRRRAPRRRGQRRGRGRHDARRSCEGLGEDGFDFDGGLARGRAQRPGDDHLHVGHDRAAQGRPAHARQRARHPARLLPGRRRSRTRAASSRGCRWRTSPSARAATTCRSCAGTRRRAAPIPREVVAYLPEVRPTWFFAVPRIWEKLKAAVRPASRQRRPGPARAISGPSTWG